MSFKMLSLLIFVILIFNATTNLGTDPAIKFNIQAERFNGQSVLTCDHSTDRLAHQLSTYTVYEGHEFTVVTNYNATINHILCHDLNDDHFQFQPVIFLEIKLVNNFMANKRMGTRWKCTILTHLDNAVIQPVVQYKYHNYSAAYCFMEIHVRQKVAPQTILVNNVVLPANRINLSQKDVDLIAEYQYADGDVVNVTCINERNYKMLTMEYNMAGRMSDESIMNDLSSSKMIGFVTKLHSRHNNSYMICTHKDEHDYTKVMVKFFIRTNFNNVVGLIINGMLIRTQIVNPTNNQYRIDYKYVSNQLIEVVCSVKRTEVKLFLLDGNFEGGNYSKREFFYKENQKSIVKFSLSSKNKKLECATDYLNGTSAETVAIYFTEGNFPVEQYPLHIKFARDSGIEMDLYNDFKLNVILYEFHDEGLSLACGKLPLPLPPGPILYLQLGSESKCNKTLCFVSKTFKITRQYENTVISCYLKEQPNTTEAGTVDILHREIRVIFHESVPTTTTPTSTTSTITSTTTTRTSTITTPSTALTTKHASANLVSSETPTNSSNNDTLLYSLTGVVVVVLVIILVVLYYTIIKKRYCVRSDVPIPAPRIDPASVYYENQLAVFKPINEREAAEMAENHYEEID